MKFKLKFLFWSVELETPAVEQVSTIDVVSAVLSAVANNPMVHTLELVNDDDPEE